MQNMHLTIFANGNAINAPITLGVPGNPWVIDKTVLPHGQVIDIQKCPTGWEIDRASLLFLASFKVTF